MSGDLLGGIRERHAGDVDAERVGWFGVRGLERGVQRNRGVRGDHDGGEGGHRDVQLFEFPGDYYGSIGGIDHGEHDAGRDGVLRTVDHGRAGRNRDSAIDLRVAVVIYHLRGDTEQHRAERRNHRSGVRNSDVLQGNDDHNRIRARRNCAGGGMAMMLMTLMCGGIGMVFRGKRRAAMAFAMVLIMVAMGIGACGSLPTSPTGQATPPGTYFISLTTSLNGHVQTLPNFLTLVVK